MCMLAAIAAFAPGMRARLKLPLVMHFQSALGIAQLLLQAHTSPKTAAAIA